MHTCIGAENVGASSGEPTHGYDSNYEGNSDTGSVFSWKKKKKQFIRSLPKVGESLAGVSYYNRVHKRES